MAATNQPEDVEFLDDPVDDPTAWHDHDPPRRLRSRVTGHVVAAVLALAGAAVAVVTPFRIAYTLRVADEDGFEFATDGWGRNRSPGDMTDASQHGPRFGLVYCVAAGLALVGVVLWELHRRRRRPPRAAAIGSAATLVGAGAILATTVNLLLAALANLDSLRGSLRRSEVIEDTRPGAASLSLGWLIWLGLAAGVLLVVAVIVRACAAPRTQGTERTATLTDRDASMDPPS